MEDYKVSYYTTLKVITDVKTIDLYLTNLIVFKSDVICKELYATKTLHLHGSVSSIDTYRNNVDLKWVEKLKAKVVAYGECSKMFEGSNLKLGLFDWDVSNVTDMNSMFENSNITCDISNWVTSSVTYMSWMFFMSKSVPDISNWDTSNVKSMYGMFERSPIPDTSKWVISPNTDTRYMYW